MHCKPLSEVVTDPGGVTLSGALVGQSAPVSLDVASLNLKHAIVESAPRYPVTLGVYKDD